MFQNKKNGKITVLLLAIFLFNLLVSGSVYTKAAEDDGWPQGPEVKGDGAIVVDAETGNILYEKNIYN